MKKTLIPVSALWILAALTARATDDMVIADFEGTTYGDWTVAGEAFGPGPAQGTLPNQMSVDGFLGKGLVNSYFHGDRTTGTLTSPEFVIKRKFISFLIGGGGWPGQTCMNLLVDGRSARTATGPNTQPGGSEHLDWSQRKHQQHLRRPAADALDLRQQRDDLVIAERTQRRAAQVMAQREGGDVMQIAGFLAREARGPQTLQTHRPQPARRGLAAGE